MGLYINPRDGVDECYRFGLCVRHLTGQECETACLDIDHHGEGTHNLQILAQGRVRA